MRRRAKSRVRRDAADAPTRRRTSPFRGDATADPATGHTFPTGTDNPAQGLEYHPSYPHVGYGPSRNAGPQPYMGGPFWSGPQWGWGHGSAPVESRPTTRPSGSSYGPGRGLHHGRGPRNYVRSDERIREDVCECLTHDPDVDATDVEVRVEAGEVVLTGTVPDRRQRRLAEEVCEGCPGVRDVRNELQISNSDRPGRGRAPRRPL